MTLINNNRISNIKTAKTAAATASAATKVLATSSSPVIAGSLFLIGSLFIRGIAGTVATHSDNNNSIRILDEKNIDDSRRNRSGEASFSTPAHVISTKRNFTTKNGSYNDNDINATSSSIQHQKPNQTTSAFTEMTLLCPQIIKSYASCVIQAQNNGMLQKQQGVCEEEYRQLMDCFRLSRRSLSS